MQNSDFTDVYEWFTHFFGSAAFAVAAVAIVLCSTVALAAAVSAVLRAYAMYNLSSRQNRRFAWMAWLSIPVPLFGAYSLTMLPGEKPFGFFRIYTFNKRINAFWLLLAVCAFGAVFAGISGALGTLPFIGVVLKLSLRIVQSCVAAFCAVYGYLCLNDVLEFYKPGNGSNKVVAIFSLFVPFMLTIVLLKLMKLEPAAQQTINA